MPEHQVTIIAASRLAGQWMCDLPWTGCVPRIPHIYSYICVANKQQ